MNNQPIIVIMYGLFKTNRSTRETRWVSHRPYGATSYPVEGMQGISMTITAGDQTHLENCPNVVKGEEAPADYGFSTLPIEYTSWQAFFNAAWEVSLLLDEKSIEVDLAGFTNSRTLYATGVAAPATLYGGNIQNEALHKAYPTLKDTDFQDVREFLAFFGCQETDNVKVVLERV